MLFLYGVKGKLYGSKGKRELELILVTLYHYRRRPSTYCSIKRKPAEAGFLNFTKSLFIGRVPLLQRKH